MSSSIYANKHIGDTADSMPQNKRRGGGRYALKQIEVKGGYVLVVEICFDLFRGSDQGSLLM